MTMHVDTKPIQFTFVQWEVRHDDPVNDMACFNVIKILGVFVKTKYIMVAFN